MYLKFSSLWGKQFHCTFGTFGGQQRKSIVLSAILGSQGWLGAILVKGFASLGFPSLGEANPLYIRHFWRSAAQIHRTVSHSGKPGLGGSNFPGGFR